MSIWIILFTIKSINETTFTSYFVAPWNLYYDVIDWSLIYSNLISYYFYFLINESFIMLPLYLYFVKQKIILSYYLIRYMSCFDTNKRWLDNLTRATFAKHAGIETCKRWKHNVWIFVDGYKFYWKNCIVQVLSSILKAFQWGI